MILLQTATGDFATSNGHLSFTSGAQEVKQRLANNFKTFLGEEPLDQEIGVPYIQQILQKTTPLSVSQAILEDVARSTDGVKDLVNFKLDFDPATRKASFSFTAQTIAGDIPYTGSFP